MSQTDFSPLSYEDSVPMQLDAIRSRLDEDREIYAARFTLGDRRMATIEASVRAMDGAQALQNVLSWPIRCFVWNATGLPDVGVIAHELQAVKPSAVVGEKDAMLPGGQGPVIDPQAVDYSKLVPELAAAVQHLAFLIGVRNDAQ